MYTHAVEQPYGRSNFKEIILDNCFVPRKQISFNNIKTGLLAYSVLQRLPIFNVQLINYRLSISNYRFIILVIVLRSLFSVIVKQ
jgi:hypothetical protein